MSMKNYVEKIGTDNVLHFLGGGWLTLLLGLLVHNVFTDSGLGIAGSLVVGGFATLCLEYFKEWVLDESFDWHDVMATLVGIVLSVAVVVLS